MNELATKLIAITTLALLIVGCGKKDGETALKNKRNAAVKKDKPAKPPETVEDSTNRLVEELKKKQAEQEAQQANDGTLEVDREQAIADAKAFQELVTAIVHGGNDDAETQTVKQVGEREVWIDRENRTVIVAANVCLRQGPLEMLITPMGKKTHETILTTKCWASQIHFCMALCGVLPGHPIKYEPEYTPATGPQIDLEIVWKEGDEIKRARGQDFIRDADTQKPLDTHWVFGGSIAVEGEGYYANGGPMVCVSNFGIAMLDIPDKSGDSDGMLLYEANTEMIPPINTQVFVYFKPKMAEDEFATDEQIADEVERLSKATPLD